MNNPWLLPDGIEEILPPDAAYIEQLRRLLLDRCQCWGYEFVIPPLVEYMDSLLTGVGHNDLELRTFKVVDQLTGRLLGLSADITPQVARIDAHSLQRQGPTRLCYAGTVLHTKPIALTAGRSVLQLGAELYGSSSIAADTEVVSLLLDLLHLAGCEKLCVDLGHVGIYRALAQWMHLTPAQEDEVFNLLQRKASDDLQTLLVSYKVSAKAQKILLQLLTLSGEKTILKQAKQILKNLSKPIDQALEDLTAITQAIEHSLGKKVGLYFDLSELRGYHYHTGIVFSVYMPGYGRAIAQGGRYDEVGKAFGRARPATGFSLDLKILYDYWRSQHSVASQAAIMAPNKLEQSLLDKVNELRAQGETVIFQLPEDKVAATKNTLHCDRHLVYKKQQWLIEPIKK